MTDREAFLRAIRAHPDDDTPRLIYADWLDEHDDPAQAEFIRLQVELEPIRDQLDQPRVRELAERESILLATHGHEWLGPAADLVGPYPAFGPVFRRGLPEMICLSLGTFLDRAEELFAACPTVREVCVYGVQGHERALLTSPVLEKVETLEIADWIDEGDYFETAIGMLRHIRRFRLWGDMDHFFPEHLAAAAIADWPELIEVVDLDDNRVRFGDVRAESLNELTGRSLVRVERPFEVQFPLSGNLGHGFHAGSLSDGVPVILAPINAHSAAMIAFFPDGQFDCVDRIGESASWHVTRRTFGFTPGSIRVHPEPTVTDGFSIRLWPSAFLRDYLWNPFDRPPGVSDHWWESRGGVLKRWLHEGRFVIEWDEHEYTADATGKIIAG